MPQVQRSLCGAHTFRLNGQARVMTVADVMAVMEGAGALADWRRRGPTDQARRVQSWADYERAFGGLHRDSAMSYAVYQFFGNGGRVTATDAQTASVTIGDLTLKATDEQGVPLKNGQDGTPLKPGDADFWNAIYLKKSVRNQDPFQPHSVLCSYSHGNRIDSEATAMATVREGNRPVLLVVDVQVGVMNDAWDAPRIIRNVARAVERARAQGVPVIWIQHADTDLPQGSPEWQWAPPLQPGNGEILIHKRFNSSFEQTTLDDELAKLGATHVVLAGAATNWCIRATAYAALDRGYDLTLINDAHTTGTIELDNGVRIEAATVIQELNIAMTWLSYPGRTNGAATAEDVAFATPGGAHEATVHAAEY